jgi:hypothetical protein
MKILILLAILLSVFSRRFYSSTRKICVKKDDCKTERYNKNCILKKSPKAYVDYIKECSIDNNLTERDSSLLGGCNLTKYTDEKKSFKCADNAIIDNNRVSLICKENNNKGWGYCKIRNEWPCKNDNECENECCKSINDSDPKKCTDKINCAKENFKFIKNIKIIYIYVYLHIYILFAKMFVLIGFLE